MALTVDVIMHDDIEAKERSMSEGQSGHDIQ